MNVSFIKFSDISDASGISKFYLEIPVGHEFQSPYNFAAQNLRDHIENTLNSKGFLVEAVGLGFGNLDFTIKVNPIIVANNFYKRLANLLATCGINGFEIYGLRFGE